MSASLWGCELKFLRKKGGLQAEWSASLWGCELKSSQNTAKSQEFGQPPCEAVSWNCWDIYQATPDIPSASLWGCELKYYENDGFGSLDSQPPCEAVSWNIDSDRVLVESAVSLLVRLWVEIEHLQPWCMCFSRQPPCEAVSWNLITTFFAAFLQEVSLLVRLWVEIHCCNRIRSGCPSASLWGCELKCQLCCKFQRRSRSASLWGCELK